jgi:hypothetical protein
MVTNSRPGSYNVPIDFQIPTTPPPGSGSPARLDDTFKQIYATIQQIIKTFVQFCGIGPRNPGEWSILAGSPTTILSGNLRRLYVIASEPIAANAMISLWNDAGVLKVRNASATNNTKPCDGFCSSEGGISTGVAGEVKLSTGIVTLVGLVIGTRYYLSTAAGLVTTVPPVAAGNIEQYLGIAITTTDLYLNTCYWIQH